MVWTPLRRTVFSLISVGMSYWLYCLLIVPLIEPRVAQSPFTSQKRHGIADRSPTAGYRPLLEPHFSGDDWELNDATVLKSPRAILLFQEHKARTRDALTIEPCTVILYASDAENRNGHDRKREASQRTFLLKSQRAQVNFERGFDLRRGRMSRIVGGAFEGRVTIESGQTRPGAEDRLVISTADVRITASRISTSGHVHIRYGGSLILGRGLTIRLADSSPELSTENNFLSAIQSVELSRVDKVSVNVPRRASGDGANQLPPDETRQEYARYELTCGGPFHLDLATNVATVEEYVDMHQIHPNGQSDQLACQRVTIYFSRGPTARAVSGPIAAQNRSDDALRLTDSMEVERFVAVGHPVRLNLASHDCRMTCEYVDYDMAKRSIHVESQKLIRIDYGQVRIEAPRLQCTLNDANQIETVRSTGPGRFFAARSTGNADNVELSWRDELSMKPKGSQRLLSVHGTASVISSDRGSMLADLLQVWFEQGQKRESSSSSTTARAPRNSAFSLSNLQPAKLIARGNVRFDSPQLRGLTGNLDIWFRDRTTPRRLAARLADKKGQTPFRTLQSKGMRKFELQGDAIRIVLARQGEDFLPSDLAVQGRARFTELSKKAKDQQGIELLGREFQVNGIGSARMMATVLGAPATINLGTIQLTGEKVRIDRKANKAWLDGPGQASMPLRSGLPGERLDGAELAVITWKAGMDFDGRQIVARQDVSIRTSNQWIQADSVGATLNTHVDFANPPKDGTQNTDARFVQASGNVRMENRSLDDSGLVQSIDRLQVSDVTADTLTGELRAHGPGWISSVRRGSSNFAVTGRVSRPTAEDQLQYIAARFQNEINGNVKQQMFRLAGQVSAVHGPVPSWDRVIPIESSRDNSIRLQCDQLQIARSGTNEQNQPAIDVRAIGNTVVTGDQFEAHAHQVKYSQRKDQLILQGDGLMNAELIQFSGERETRVPGRQIIFWPQRGRFEVRDAGPIEATQF